MTATKTSTGGLMKFLGVVVIVVAGGLYFNNNRPGYYDKGGNDKRIVILTAIWHPSPRPVGVLVRTFIDNAARNEVTTDTAPHWWTYTVEKGKRVEIRAKVNDPNDIFIGCSISIDGNEVDTEHISRGKLGDEVICWAVT